MMIPTASDRQSPSWLMRRRIMRTPPFLFLFSVFCASAVFAGPADSVVPVWLRSQGNSNPGSLEVFNAFHTRENPAETKRTATLLAPMPMQGVPADYPHEFRSFDGT